MQNTYTLTRSARQELRADLLELNRSIAGWLGLDPRYTISSNIAALMSRAFRIPFATAKLWFHAGVAGAATLLLRSFGLAAAAAFGIGGLLVAWLEGFDTSRRRQ